MNTTTERRSALWAFLAGEVPLSRVFWLHGVVAGFAAGIALSGLGGMSPGLQRIWAVLMLIYLLVWYVALWRSTERYQGPAIWKWAARSVVAMPFVGILLTVALSAGNRPVPQPVAPPVAAPVAQSTLDKEGKPCTEVTEFLGECKRQP